MIVKGTVQMSLAAALLAALVFTALPRSAAAQAVADNWRFTLTPPADGWQQPGFNDAGWKAGPGGFGTVETPNTRVNTAWNTKNIWLRKQFTLTSVPQKPALLIYHDEDAEVFINGTLVDSFKGYITNYTVVPLKPEAKTSLKEGVNLLAVHCRQETGGQFIDVHLVDADAVPTLPIHPRKPFVSKLITTWGEAVTAENAWTEYPRPQMQRKNWQNLNGPWDYAITSVKEQVAPPAWGGKILVPFALESKLGGVQQMLQSGQALWYRRSFNLQPATTTLLNFEAVDYHCQVFVNNQPVGEHKGGNTPFTFDITAAVKSGANEVLLRVEDEQEGFQLNGKQTRNPRSIWYTQVSGIWQTVWVEQVEQSYINDLKIQSDATAGTITVTPKITGNATTVEIAVKEGENVVALANHNDGSQAATLRIASPKLWSPDAPYLYNLEITLKDKAGKIVDSVSSYAGIRTVSKIKDAQGHLRFALNGKELFHWGPLDQGWWPDGLLTPPSDEAMKFEIAWLKKAGFNMIRKHIKVEPRRYYYHCDRLGMMMWQDHVSGGARPKWSRLQPNPQDAEWPDEHHDQFMVELERMINTLENHPCIVSWVPFNEAWGQHRTLEVGQWTVKRDPSRLVNIASGGNFWPVGDVVDAHQYPHPGFPFDLDKEGRFDGYVKVVGEFGGHGYPVSGHLWDAERDNWGYGGLPKNEAEYKERYKTSLQMLNDLRAKGIAGAVYTQTTDVEGEINGLISYDRKAIKISAEELSEISSILFK
ncbi:MAG: glycoside hydrolase family 2 TIM barrel-domain containing protein [Kiritimatiellae bacterium]|nr:glycoside hydrolase family 2 TIM barrel-domain containing protein [Kiritimatiellia bacterium]